MLGLIGFSSGVLPFVIIMSPFLGVNINAESSIVSNLQNSPNILWGILYLIIATAFTLLSYNVSSIARGSNKRNLKKIVAKEEYSLRNCKSDIIDNIVKNIEFNTNSIFRKSILFMCGLLSLVYGFSLVVMGILNQTSEEISQSQSLFIRFHPLILGAFFLTVLMYAFLPLVTASFKHTATPVKEMRGGVPEFDASKEINNRPVTLVAIIIPPGVIAIITILYISYNTKNPVNFIFSIRQNIIQGKIGIVLLTIIFLSILTTAVLYWAQNGQINETIQKYV